MWQPSPSYPRTLTAYPTLVLGGTPGFFFHQNDRKGCKRDYFRCPGSLCFAFWCNWGGWVVATPLRFFPGRSKTLKKSNDPNQLRSRIWPHPLLFKSGGKFWSSEILKFVQFFGQIQNLTKDYVNCDSLV